MPPQGPKQVRDALVGFPGGVNSGVAPSLLTRDQLAAAINATVRGGYITNRPSLREIVLDFGGDVPLQAEFELGRFQGLEFYLSDDGEGMFIWSIGGHLYKVRPDATLPTGTVQEVSVSFAVGVSVVFIVPAIGSTVSIIVNSTANMSAGADILIGGANYIIVSINGPTSLTVQNVDDTAANHASGTILQYFDLNPASRQIAWMQQAEKWLIIQDGQSVPIIFDGASSRRANVVGANPEISAGRMMAYWLGRLWWVNPDGRSFRAGDLVYSASGTSSQRLRDSVLKQTQNTFISDGGNFTVPSNAGPITAMLPVAVLDASLGQGPLQISTATMMFGCTASTDSTIWQTTNSPILGVSLIENGSLSQWSTVLVNGDMFYRAIDGIRTLVLGRREFNVWGNVPVSREMNAILEADQENLLNFASSITFDNRLLTTSGPTATQRGTYHRGIIALDFDVISSMRQKLPPVYDGLWTGLRVLKLVKGRFGNTERAFAATLTTAGTIKFFEILPSGAATQDGNDTAITWTFETADIFKESGIGAGQKTRLWDGEMFVDQIVGFVSFQIYFRPDQSSCWVPWNNFSVCNKTCQQAAYPDECLTDPYPGPGFRNRFGFGEPPGHCNPDTNSPYREGWTFQIKIVVTGSCRIKALRFKGVVVDEPECAPAMCQGDCYNPVVYENFEQSVGCDDPLAVLTNVSATLPTGFSITNNRLVVAAGTYTSLVSAADATQIAYKALKLFWTANIASGALDCVGITWTCSGIYLNDDGDEVLLDAGCENQLPGTTTDEFSVDFNPVLPIYDDICDATPVHASFCADMGIGSTPISFPENKIVTFGGAYHVVSPASSPAGGCPINETFVRIQVFGLDGGDQEFLLNTSDDLETGFDVSGVWKITGTLSAGSNLLVVVSTGVLAKYDASIVVPPTAQITITTATIV